MREYPTAQDIREFEAWREEEAAVSASQDADPRSFINYEDVESGCWDDDQADGVKEAA